MSQTSSGQPIWTKEVVGTREESQGQMHVLQPLVPLPHVAQLLSPAALHPGFDFPHKGFHSPGEKRPTQPHVGNGSHTRLPGVRDLLMPQPAGSESRFDPDRRHYSAHEQLLQTGGLAFSPILLPARAESQPTGTTLSTSKQNTTEFRRWPRDDSDKTGPALFLPQPGHQTTPPSHVQRTPPAARPQGTSGFPFSRATTTTPPRPSINSFERFTNSPDEPVTAGNVDRRNPNSPSVDAWASSTSRQEWGMTKAGKPRKRLALACLNCRQKKIRCHPNSRTMRCNHCERTGSYCRFEGGTRNPNTGAPFRDQSLQPAASPDGAVTDAKYPKRTADDMLLTPSNSHSRPNTSTGMKPSIHRLLSSPEESAASRVRPLKRQRADTEPLDDTHRSRVLGHPAVGPTSSPLQVDFQYEVVEDPFQTFPLTMEYLDLYFTHVNQVTYSMFPKTPFLSWAQHHKDKSVDDKMVIYAMMAMGSRFSSRPESAAHSANFTRTAKTAEQRQGSRFSSQLVQTRLILALILFAEGQKYGAWDFCGKASKMVIGLKYNTETMVACENSEEDGPIYGLTGPTLVECRRRTFWSVYIMDHFSSVTAGRLSTLRNDDCFLRLPCLEQSFDQQDIPETPYFTTGTDTLSALDTRNLGNMAYLIMMASTWNDLLQNLYLTRQRPPGEDAEYESFHADRTRQLQIFAGKIPTHLQFTEVNIEQALGAGYAGTLISLQGLWLMGRMKLNRHASWNGLSPDSRVRHLKLSQEYARQTLQATDMLAQIYRRKISEGAGWSFSTPSLGYAIISAVDILTSVGSLRDLRADLPILKTSLEFMHRLGKFWASARAQTDQIIQRLKGVEDVLHDPATPQTVFQATGALENPFGNDVDLFFAPPLEMRLAALGLEAQAQDGGVLTLKEYPILLPSVDAAKTVGGWDGGV